MPRKPHLHRADEFELSVDEHGQPHFVDLHHLSRFGRRHGGNRVAIALIFFIEALTLILTVVVGSWLRSSGLSDHHQGFILLGIVAASLLAVSLVLLLYLRWYYALGLLALLFGGLGLLIIGIIALA